MIRLDDPIFGVAIMLFGILLGVIIINRDLFFGKK